MKKLVTLAGGLLALLCVAFFIRTLATHWSGIRDIPLGGPVYGGMAAALVLYCATHVSGAKSWQLILRSLGANLDFRGVLGILTISQFAKYVPGNVGHHLGRVLMARRAGVGTDVAIASVGLETVLALAAAAFCALGAVQLLPVIGERYGLALGRNLAIVAVAGVLVVGVTVAFPIPRRHLASALERCRSLVAPGNRMRSAMVWAQYLLNFTLGAAALACISTALSSNALPGMTTLVGIYAVAWLVGFLIPGAPAGLGVRDALLVLGLSPLLGREAATAATALFRVVTVAGDGIVFALGWTTLNPHVRRLGGSITGSERTK